MEQDFPKIGLGTWQLKPEICKQSVLTGLKLGYTLIDTAQAYKNEHSVGAALVESKIPRNQVIISTKIFPLRNRPKLLISGFQKSLEKLQTDYVDILFVHFPAFGYRPETTLKAMKELMDRGQVRAIGVSNFTLSLMEQALSVCPDIKFLQIELHPLLQQKKLRAFCAEKGIKVIGYSPLGHGNIKEVAELKAVAERTNLSVAQICLAWEAHHGVIPIPKSTSEKHMKSNLEAVDIKLSDEDVKTIDSIALQKRFVSPPFASPKWDD